MTTREASIVRYVLLVAVVVGGIFTIVATGNGPTPPPAVAGTIAVNVGFGAAITTPYQCTGQGYVTITPQNLTGTTGKGQPETKQFQYSGYSSSNPSEPGCQQIVTFGDLRTGTWLVTNGTVTCTAKVISAQMTDVRIWHNVCQ